jgi:hypothetical protein
VKDAHEELAAELGVVAVRPRGRPTVYTEDLAAEICDAVALGFPLQDLCEQRSHWPERATIYRWADERADFRQRFDRARELKAHLFVDEMPSIAEKATPEDVRVAELKIKTRQWLAPQLARGVYGQAPPVQVQHVTVNLAAVAQAAEARIASLAERLEAETPVLGRDWPRSASE